MGISTGLHQLSTADIQTLVHVFLRKKSLYRKYCVGRFIFMMQNLNFQPKIYDAVMFKIFEGSFTFTFEDNSSNIIYADYHGFNFDFYIIWTFDRGLSEVLFMEHIVRPMSHR
jgi:hypothetical protein